MTEYIQAVTDFKFIVFSERSRTELSNTILVGTILPIRYLNKH
ncbi:protein of unknown function [Chryseobacterium sp. JV274]|nr:protein of unknown function [Chryseobacterium sp. JV274]